MAYNPAYFTRAVEHLTGLKVNEGFEASDTGQGPFISLWLAEVPQPSQAEIEAVDTGALMLKASVPSAVTPRQARLALLTAGLLDQVEEAVNVAGGATKITWEFATTIKRNSPLIETLVGSLGLTSEQIDTLFRYAAAQ